MKDMAATAEYTLADQAKMALATNYFAWQSRLVLPELGRRVLEVGCGTGNFTRWLLDREAVLGIDVEPGCVAALRQRYPNAANLRVEVSADPAAHAAFKADSCVCLNVLEHIQDDVSALRGISSALTPGSAIVIVVPAFPALFGPIDRRLGHYRRYTRASLHAAAVRAELTVAKLHYFNFAGFFAWWANARIFQRREQSEQQIRIYDSCLVPFLSALEARVKPPFGQSLFAVLRKP